ncbi:hypothetical protein M0804_013335 [Polistes exclamans]|nr:hypothetical protein M0804_013335 [Polistes exclamans]
MSNENLLPQDNQITEYQERMIGMLRPFEELEECTFCAWLNVFEFVTDMIEIPNDKMAEIINKKINNNFQELIKQNNPSVNFSELSYDEIINQYFYYIKPIDVKYMHRIRFLVRNQFEQEPIEKYANNLQKIYNKCQYRDEREEILCVKFINGLRDDNCSTHIKLVTNLQFTETLDKVMKIAEFNGKNNCECDAHPTINTYSPRNEGIFYEWLNKFEYVANIFCVPDDRMVESFRSMVDEDVHTNVKNAYPSVNFSELSYEEMINYYLRYFDSSGEIYLHRKRFLCRKQYEQESIENYAERLEKIYDKCEYDDCQREELSIEFLNGLRDSIVKTQFEIQYGFSFSDIVLLAIDFEKLHERDIYKSQNLSMIDTYRLGNEGMFYEWLNKFEYKEYTSKENEWGILKIFNKTIDNDVHTAVKIANPSINFSELSYDKIINYYLQYFASSDETDLHRKRFMCRNQYEKETIEDYIYNLWRIISMCNSSYDRQKMVYERFLNGIFDKEIKTILNKLRGFLLEDMQDFAEQLTRFKEIISYLNPALLRIPSFHPEKGEVFYVWLNKFEYIADIIRIQDDEIVKFFNYMIHNDVHRHETLIRAFKCKKSKQTWSLFNSY